MRRVLAFTLAAGALGACGGGGEREQAVKRTPAPDRGLERARVTITGWADTLRRSDVEGAARAFALPLVISQGTAVRLTTRAQVRAFNASLPCGSKVTAVTRGDAGYFVASFELTERPGQRCDGPGGEARVAFKLSGNRIREWRRVLDAAPRGDET